MTVLAWVLVIGVPIAFAVGWFGAKVACERSLRKMDEEVRGR